MDIVQGLVVVYPLDAFGVPDEMCIQMSAQLALAINYELNTSAVSGAKCIHCCMTE